jgi:hypothetical protein
MSFDGIAEHYRKWYRPRSEAELNCFRRQPTLAAAVALAAVAEDDRGRRFPHQRRLKQADLARARVKLVENVSSLQAEKSFARLHERVETLTRSISGLGVLYQYDTALRVGAKLGLLPANVYLHAGTRIGAKALRIRLEPNQRFLFTTDIPRALLVLAPHEIEDVLCIYKKVLGDALDGKPIHLPDDDRCYLDDPEEAE